MLNRYKVLRSQETSDWKDKSFCLLLLMMQKKCGKSCLKHVVGAEKD